MKKYAIQEESYTVHPDLLLLRDKMWKAVNQSELFNLNNQATAKECADVAIQFAIDILNGLCAKYPDLSFELHPEIKRLQSLLNKQTTMSKKFTSYKALIEAEDKFVQDNYGTNWTNDDMIEFADFVRHSAKLKMGIPMSIMTIKEHLKLFIESKKVK